ncbi:MAG: extracellular solute-binding protein [Coprobacillus sp.]|nr:extracellular solute-binding protein [Coprobacillus sp.]
MKRLGSLFLACALIAGIGLPLTSCSSSSETSSQTLRLLNWEDYIYEQDISSGYTADDLVDQFVDYVKENYPQYSNVRVVYDTTDTNETMYNELMTGKSEYDLICPSDYMIQRLLSQDLLEPLDMDLIPNYQNYASKRIKSQLDNITAHNSVTDTDESLSDYAVGYMWGTLGLLFNPNYKNFTVDAESAIDDMQSWSVLWDETYKGTISIKDSMRDTYAAALMYTYDEELTDLREQYESGELDSDTYNTLISEIFNRCDDETIELVEESLNSLKKNIFGLEVDSGKEDIVTGKIGINLAWSGDAVYSIDQAQDPEQVSNPFELCYAVPKNGANIWFDGWVMPKLENRSQEQYELAHLFLNFISDPYNAAQNMDYIGYTSFIAGDEILELVRDWYDIRTNLIWYNEEYDEEEDDEEYEYYDYVYYLEDNQEVEVDYDDCHFESESDPDFNPKLYAEFSDGTEAGFIGYYNERLIIDDDIEEVDLTYFFNDTLTEYEDSDAIFYSDEYLPYEDESGEANICVGRQFFTQYPSEETIIRCAVMQDYGSQNDAILKMWEDFKSDPLPTWAIVVFSIEIAAIIAVVIYYYARRHYNNKVRENIKKSENPS